MKNSTRLISLLLCLLLVFSLMTACKKQTEDENKNEIAIEKIPEYSDVVNSTAKYSYYENPYYTHALKRYVDFVNKAYKNGGGSQQITITTLDDLFKEAGISKQLRKK